MSDESTPAEAEAEVEETVEAGEFAIDEEAGTVATRVGSVGWPEGAENEEGTGPGQES